MLMDQNKVNQMNELKLALSDFAKAIQKYQLWLYLGQVEVKQKYRRSVIGPWWITISMSIFILAMGLVFSKLFHQSMNEYLPNFTAGFLFWTFFSSTILESAETLPHNSGFIKQVNLPIPVYIFKLLTKQTIILFHNLVVFIIVCLICRAYPTKTILTIIPGCILFYINILWISTLIALICTRFRDMVPIISSCMQIAFFITPISWSRNLLSQDSLILKINPLSYLLDIVKAPLTGASPLLESWIISISFGFIGMLITLIVYGKKRNQIPFWVH